MSLADLATIGSIVSSVAVAVSLLYLGLQVHQSTRHTKALIHQGRSQRAVDVHLSLAEPHMAKAWIVAAGGRPTPDAVTARQFQLLALTYDLSWEDTFLQHEMGLLAEEQFADYRAKLVGFLRHQGLRAYFAGRADAPQGRTRFHQFMMAVAADAAPRPAA